MCHLISQSQNATGMSTAGDRPATGRRYLSLGSRLKIRYLAQRGEFRQLQAWSSGTRKSSIPHKSTAHCPSGLWPGTWRCVDGSKGFRTLTLVLSCSILSHVRRASTLSVALQRTSASNTPTARLGRSFIASSEARSSSVASELCHETRARKDSLWSSLVMARPRKIVHRHPLQLCRACASRRCCLRVFAACLRHENGSDPRAAIEDVRRYVREAFGAIPIAIYTDNASATATREDEPDERRSQLPRAISFSCGLRFGKHKRTQCAPEADRQHTHRRRLAASTSTLRELWTKKCKGEKRGRGKHTERFMRRHSPRQHARNSRRAVHGRLRSL
jgi:hypothetical protein